MLEVDEIVARAFEGQTALEEKAWIAVKKKTKEVVDVFKAWDKSRQTGHLIKTLKDLKTASSDKSEQQFTVALAALSKGGKDGNDSKDIRGSKDTKA